MPNRFTKYAQQPQAITPPSPMLPIQVQGGQLGNVGQGIHNRKDAATLDAEVRAAKADAATKELQLRQDRIAAGLDPDTGKPVVQAGPTTGLSGEDYLKTLPAADQRLVKSMAEGHMIPPTGRAAASPYWQKLLGQTLQYDPSFDAIDYGARYNTRKDFTSGQSSRNIKALNTAIGHVSQLADQISGTASHGGFPLATTVNALENAYERGKGASGITKFAQTAGAVSSELTQVFRGTGGAEADVQRYLSELDPNASEEQKKAAVGNILGLLKSRLDALNDQYSKGMGTAAAGLDVLDPHSKQALGKYLPGFKASPPNPPTGTPPSGPGYVPASTGPTGQLGSSNDGYNDTPDPQSAAFWEDAARKGTPYGTALRQWQSDARARGMQGITPPPPEGYDKARAYIRQNPNIEYHPFNSIQRTPIGGALTITDLVEKGLNYAASSGPGAATGHALNAAFAGLPERLAGDQGQYFDAVSRAEHPVASTLGDIGGFTAGALGANKVLGSAAPKLGALGQFLTKTPGRQGLISDMAFGGATGAVQDQQNPLLGAGEGALAMGAGNLAGRGLVNTLASALSPTGGKLADLYAMGVRPSIGQRAGGLVNNFEEKFQSIPFVGDMIHGTRQKARDQFQVGLFNDALGEIGQKLPQGMEPGHAPHKFAQTAFSKAYDSAERGMTAVADPAFGTDLAGLQKTVSTLPEASQKQFSTIWDASVGRRFSLGTGALSGDAYKSAMSELSKKAAAIRKNPQGDHELASALDDAMSAIRGSATRNSPPEAVAALDATDRGYAKLVRLEDASRRQGGDAATFSPIQYNAAVKNAAGGIRNRGYLAGNALNSDIAAKGLSLQDVVSNSGTFDRYAPAAAMMAGSFIAPKAAIPLGLFGAANAPGIRGLTTGLMAPRGIPARTLADMIRAQSGNAGILGGSVGLSLLPPR